MTLTRPLNQQSGMPQMGPAFAGWQKPIVLTKRTQTITAGLVSYSDVVINFRGTIQPLSPEEIELKPQAQWSWKWLQIHVQVPSSLTLTTNDQIIYNTELYKIMAVKDYSLNAYIEYHAVRDFQ
jgi:hypothetical protein